MIISPQLTMVNIKGKYMNAKKAFVFFLSLLISVCLFAGYTHVTFSLSSAISVEENVRYRFLGTTDWVEVKDKSKVSMCIDPTLDNRIVIETAGEDKVWSSLCTASIMALPKNSTGASAKWMWNDLSDSATGARWSITGGKWNYIPLSERSVTVDNIKLDKLTLFIIQSTKDGENWENVAIHGVIPVKYDESKLTDDKCDKCSKENEIVSLIPEEEFIIEEKEEVKEEPVTEVLPVAAAEETVLVPVSEYVPVAKKTESKPLSLNWTLYGAYTRSSRTLSYTDETEGYETEEKSGMELGAQFMFGKKVGLDLSFTLESHLYGERKYQENGIAVGLVYRDNYSSFFSPYVMAAFEVSSFSYEEKKGNYPTAKMAFGIDYWLGKGFGIHTGLEGSLSFIEEKELRPEVKIDATNLRLGFSVGALIRFGEGGER